MMRAGPSGVTLAVAAFRRRRGEARRAARLLRGRGPIMAAGRMYTTDPDALKHAGPLGFGDPSTYTADEQGPGWLSFAGVMLLIIGTLNVIYGIAAIDDAKFFVRDVSFAVGTLHTWGWVLAIVGAVQFVAGIGIFTGNPVARWIGIATAGVNAILQLLNLPSYPLLAVTIFAVDVLVLYALITFGGRRRAAAA
jgi:hypothetical protein